LNILRLTGIVFTAVVVAVLTLIISPLDFNGKAVRILYKIFSKLILLCAGVRIQCQGEENVPPNEAVLYVSNHMSQFDIPILMQALPGNVRFVYKKSMSKIPVFGWAMFLAKYIPIDRQNVRNALKSLKNASSLIPKGISVVMFPEGTRSPDGEIHDFKKGMLVISAESKCKIVPVSIRGSFNILPKNTLRIKPGLVKVIIDKPISYSDDKELLGNLKNIISLNFNNAQYEIREE